MLEIETPEPSLKDIFIVQDFPYVFPKEILGMPPYREIDFCIDLVSGATFISEAPYIMASTELKELRTQLDELLEKGYIRTSMSQWGAPILL